MSENLKDIEAITIPIVRDDCSHVYYFYAMKHNENIAGVSRDRVYDALIAEGVPFISKNYQNLHMLPMFTEQQCYGTKNFPWSLNDSVRYEYGSGMCEVAERLNEKEYLGIFMVGSNFTDTEINILGEAIRKVYSNLDELK